MLKYLNDYYPEIKKKFPDLQDWEMKKILTHGMRSLYMVTVYGADVLLHSPKYLTMYFGKLFVDFEKRQKYAELKWRIKLRIKWKREHRIWDGYYYFGMSENEYAKYSSKKSGRLKKKLTLEKLYAFKIPEESFTCLSKKYFFKIKLTEEEGPFSIYKENFETRDIVYIGKRDSKTKKINFVD